MFLTATARMMVITTVTTGRMMIMQPKSSTNYLTIRSPVTAPSSASVES